MNASSVSSKFMRVLVADHQLEQRVVIEKSLSILGYFRVCPVASFHELTLVSHYSPNLYDPFDVLIVNASLVTAEGLSVGGFFVDNPRFKHVLIYDEHRDHDGKSQTLSDEPEQQVRQVNTFSYDALVNFLSLIPQKNAIPTLH